MNKEWSELNKSIQKSLRKKGEYKEGINTLFILREKLMEELVQIRKELAPEKFSEMPFINASGYHSKTIAYSIWHIFRIEDIVANSLIKNEEEVFFKGAYKERIKSPIITTGNELVREQIGAFSSRLDLDELYQYAKEVKESTEALLDSFSYQELGRRFTDEDQERIKQLQVVSTDENACWLIEYWCGKDIRGLIQMPFSRHWIMHVEACLRIKNKLLKD